MREITTLDSKITSRPQTYSHLPLVQSSSAENYGQSVSTGTAGITANLKKGIEPVSEDSAGCNEIEHNVIDDSDTLTFDFYNLAT